MQSSRDLFNAVAKNNRALVDQYLASGLSVNTCFNGMNLVEQAAMSLHKDMIMYLLSIGAPLVSEGTIGILFAILQAKPFDTRDKTRVLSWLETLEHPDKPSLPFIHAALKKMPTSDEKMFFLIKDRYGLRPVHYSAFTGSSYYKEWLDTEFSLDEQFNPISQGIFTGIDIPYLLSNTTSLELLSDSLKSRINLNTKPTAENHPTRGASLAYLLSQCDCDDCSYSSQSSCDHMECPIHQLLIELIDSSASIEDNLFNLIILDKDRDITFVQSVSLGLANRNMFEALTKLASKTAAPIDLFSGTSIKELNKNSPEPITEAKYPFMKINLAHHLVIAGKRWELVNLILERSIKSPNFIVDDDMLDFFKRMLSEKPDLFTQFSRKCNAEQLIDFYAKANTPDLQDHFSGLIVESIKEILSTITLGHPLSAESEKLLETSSKQYIELASSISTKSQFYQATHELLGNFLNELRVKRPTWHVWIRNLLPTASNFGSLNDSNEIKSRTLECFVKAGNVKECSAFYRSNLQLIEQQENEIESLKKEMTLLKQKNANQPTEKVSNSEEKTTSDPAFFSRK